MQTTLDPGLLLVQRPFMLFMLQAEWHSETARPPATWPSSGAIQFESYSTRYRPGLDLVLNKIDLKINAGEKVALVTELVNVLKSEKSVFCDEFI